VADSWCAWAQLGAFALRRSVPSLGGVARGGAPLVTVPWARWVSVRGYMVENDEVERPIRSLVAGIIGILSVAGYAVVPSGQPITIDNRGLLGPFDVLEPPAAMYRIWLRLAVFGAGAVVALLVLGMGKRPRVGALWAAALAAIVFASAAALAYPTGPPDPPPGPCLPDGTLGPGASACRIYYSDNQPGPTYPGIRAAFLLAGLGSGVRILTLARRASASRTV
jgi:hypothetical protein